MQFVGVEEQNKFLNLFPHRFDFIYADHAKPGESPEWKTEDRYPLHDRKIMQGGKLYGVSFGAYTEYFLIDIDAGSIYHPCRDRFAIGRILEALEPLGITDFVPICSSYSQGIHLYFPLSKPVVSWQLAHIIKQLLSYKGILIDAGLLEVFPNICLYDSESGNYTKFHAHRLPLQEGSYLLNDSWQIQFSSQELFCKLWNFCQHRNLINDAIFALTLERCELNRPRLGFKGEKFLADLNNEIDPGWSGAGQTNHILGRIAMRAYIFGHRLRGGEPYTGDRLIFEIIEQACKLPGYEEFCRHRHEIYKRAEDWARCVENSRYYPYGHSPFKKQESPPDDCPTSISWNQWQRERARERICFAIADLWNQGRFPATITERFIILTTEYKFSGETLYHHRDLWHPIPIDAVENPPPPPPNILEGEGAISSSGSIAPHTPRSLLSPNGCNPPVDRALEWFRDVDLGDGGCNVSLDELLSQFDQRNRIQRE